MSASNGRICSRSHDFLGAPLRPRKQQCLHRVHAVQLRRVVKAAAAQEVEVGKFISKTEIPAFIPREVETLPPAHLARHAHPLGSLGPYLGVSSRRSRFEGYVPTAGLSCSVASCLILWVSDAFQSQFPVCRISYSSYMAGLE